MTTLFDYTSFKWFVWLHIKCKIYQNYIEEKDTERCQLANLEPLSTRNLKKDIFSMCNKCLKLILKQMLNVVIQRTLYFLYRDAVVLRSTSVCQCKSTTYSWWCSYTAFAYTLLMHALWNRPEARTKEEQLSSSSFYLWASASFLGWYSRKWHEIKTFH